MEFSSAKRLWVIALFLQPFSNQALAMLARYVSTCSQKSVNLLEIIVTSTSDGSLTFVTLELGTQ